jgi:hypothetical protein
MALYTRENGHAFTNQEVLDFWHDSDGPGGFVLVEICDHAKPGTPLNLPIWSGFQLFVLSDGDVLERLPDETAPHDFGRLVFRGSHLGDAEVAQLVIDMITRQKLEIAAAFALHFDASTFGEDAQSVGNLRRRFWSTWTGLSNEQRTQIDSELQAVSSAYSLMVAFLRDPRTPKFRGMLETVINEADLATLYDLVGD